MGLDAIVVSPLAAEAVAPFAALPLRDGCLVLTGVRFTRDRAALSRALRATLGDLLDAGDDPRGVLVFPDAWSPRGETRAEVESELGDAAAWIPRTPPPPTDALGALQERVGLPVIAAFQRALAAGDPAAMEAAMASFQAAVDAVDPDELQALLDRTLRGEPPDDA